MLASVKGVLCACLILTSFDAFALVNRITVCDTQQQAIDYSIAQTVFSKDVYYNEKLTIEQLRKLDAEVAKLMDCREMRVSKFRYKYTKYSFAFNHDEKQIGAMLFFIDANGDQGYFDRLCEERERMNIKRVFVTQTAIARFRGEGVKTVYLPIDNEGATPTELNITPPSQLVH